MTEANDTTPTTRLMNTPEGKVVVEVGARTLTIRPYRTRKGGSAEVRVAISTIYNRALMQRAAPL